MQVRQDGAPRLDARDPLNGIADAEMARMRRVAQRIDDPDIKPGEFTQTVIRQVGEVAGVGQSAKPEAQRVDVAMALEERQNVDGAAGTVDRDGLPSRDPMAINNWRVFAAGRRREAIAEALTHHLFGRRIEIDIDTLPGLDEKAAQIVDAVGVVGVLVGNQHRVEPFHIGRKKLFAQVRAGVDQNTGRAPLPGLLDQQTTAPPPVLWIIRIARAPAGSRTRHAAGGSAAKDREAQAHAATLAGRGTLENRRKKFSVV